MKFRKATVRGPDPFPVDMLRYDACWPQRNEDALAVFRSVSAPAGRTEVTLAGVVGAGVFNPERWRSFGWEVVNTEVIR